jgi:hypothetical protein
MIYIERKGIPTVSIAAAGFERDTLATARAFGMPLAPYVVVPDVITAVAPERSAAAIAERIDGIIRGLTNPAQEVSDVDEGDVENREPGPPLDYEGADAFIAYEAFNRDYLDRGWGDGFPLSPPTRERVDAMLRGTSLPPDHVVGILPPGMGVATIEKIAISAVMAGCEPRHLPVLIAALKGVIKMGTRARQWLMSTSPDAPAMMVNGPIVEELGLNTGQCSLGPGRQSRVNIVLGRGLRLALMNVGHNYPTEMDMDTIGTPEKFSLCMAEPSTGNPWPGFHVTRGFSPKTSTVTVAGIRNLYDAADLTNYTPEGVLNTIAGGIRGGANYASYRWSDPDPYDPEGGGGALVILCPDHAKACSDAGWTKEMVRDYLWGHVTTTAARLQQAYKVNPSWLLPPWKWVLALPPDEAARRVLPGFNNPERIEIANFGGPAGKSMIMMTNGPSQTIEITDRA